MSRARQQAVFGVFPQRLKLGRRSWLRALAPGDPTYGFAAVLTREVELIRALEIHPESGGHAEILPETQGRVRGHSAFSREDLVQPVRRHIDNIRELSCGYSNFLQLVCEDFAGMNGGSASVGAHLWTISFSSPRASPLAPL